MPSVQQGGWGTRWGGAHFYVSTDLARAHHTYEAAEVGNGGNNQPSLPRESQRRLERAGQQETAAKKSPLLRE